MQRRCEQINVRTALPIRLIRVCSTVCHMSRLPMHRRAGRAAWFAPRCRRRTQSCCFYPVLALAAHCRTARFAEHCQWPPHYAVSHAVIIILAAQVVQPGLPHAAAGELSHVFISHTRTCGTLSYSWICRALPMAASLRRSHAVITILAAPVVQPGALHATDGKPDLA